MSQPFTPGQGVSILGTVLARSEEDMAAGVYQVRLGDGAVLSILEANLSAVRSEQSESLQPVVQDSLMAKIRVSLTEKTSVATEKAKQAGQSVTEAAAQVGGYAGEKASGATGWFGTRASNFKKKIEMPWARSPSSSIAKGAEDDSFGSSIVKGAEGVQGAMPARSRYHVLPRRLQDDYEVRPEVLGRNYLGRTFSGATIHPAFRKSTSGDGDVNGDKYAVKTLKLSDKNKAAVKAECQIFLSVDHPHIVRLADVYERAETITLVMECMQGGELFDRLNRRTRFSEKDAREAANQMLLAINYLHSRNIVHGDITLENWLYESSTSDHLKLIDFGFSKIWENRDVNMHLSCGTLAYVAPEVLEKDYTSQCDMWSFGVVVFLLLLGYFPFRGSESDQMKKIKQGKFLRREDKFNRLSTLAIDFVEKLLQVDPNVRLTPEQALTHPWMLSRQKLIGQCTLLLTCHGDIIAGTNAAGEEIFRIAKPICTQSEVLRGEVARALCTHPCELEIYEQERILADFDVIQDFNEILVQQNVRNAPPSAVPAEFVGDLCQFAEESKFRRVCMLALAWSLSNEERATLRDAFLEIDRDGNGSITLAEFKQAVENNFELDEDVQRCFQAIDVANNGEIQYTEFLAAVTSSRISLHDDLLSKAFKKFDCDSSGYIDAANLKQILGDDYSIEHVNEIMQEVDLDHDGKISYEEFIIYARRGSTAKGRHLEVAEVVIDNVLRENTIASYPM